MLDPLTRVPQMMDGPDCIGESRIAISLCTNLLSPGTLIPDLRLFGILCHVSLLLGRLKSYREIADCDFLLQQFHTPKFSDE